MTFNGPDAATYRRRREAVLARLDDALLFLPPVPEAVYSNDVHYPYRPDTNTRYLSGFEEPAALLLAAHDGEHDGFTLFVQPRDAHSETWTGRRVGLDDARAIYGADHSHALEDLENVLLGHLQRATTLYYAYGRDAEMNRRVLDLVSRVNAEKPRNGGRPVVVNDATALLAEFRLIKGAEEAELMREAARLSAAAHVGLMETVRPGDHEYQVQAEIDCAFRRAGCAGPAYGTIAAGGVNATVLHYTRNDHRLRDGELLLVDAGGEYGGYAADITRTFPVGRRYDCEQSALYDLVLAAQLEAIEAVRPGATPESVHQGVVRTLSAGLVDLGLVGGTVDDCVESGAYKRYYMHNTSHWLGMDVHDAGAYKVGGASRPLEPGMVLTIEPGLYVRDGADAPERYRGIGIRIEDDVLVTDSGREVLTADVPKARADIEKLRRKAFG